MEVPICQTKTYKCLTHIDIISSSSLSLSDSCDKNGIGMHRTMLFTIANSIITACVVRPSRIVYCLLAPQQTFKWVGPHTCKDKGDRLEFYSVPLIIMELPYK